ncbi:hypothetical protein F652_1244 [Enterobacteriaceae bacterium bta3-1]|nr:hypothetical protein F652_1244 [Enterobacteriaceae bacterium bta3-1]
MAQKVICSADRHIIGINVSLVNGGTLAAVGYTTLASCGNDGAF